MHDLIPPGQTPDSVDVIEPIVASLLAMPVETRPELEAFLKASNTFESWTGEHLSLAQLATQTNTADEEAQQRWMKIVQQVMPKLMDMEEKLGLKLLDSPVVDTLEGTPYAPYLKQIRRRVELFRKENLELESQERDFENQYNLISGGWQTHFRGESYTKSQMSRFLASPDRETRKDAWMAVGATTLADADRLDDVWEGMFQVRQKIAENCDFENYRDYIFAAKGRDYSPQACFDYHAIVAEEVGPLIREINEKSREKLGLETWRPWDGTADPDGFEPLKPFEKAVELQDGVETMMRRLDPEFGDLFHSIRPHQDLESRPNKSQGGFMLTLPESSRPFIFTNVTGVHSDIVVMLHEAGHAFHFLKSKDARPMTNTIVPMEFNEVASMSMELLHYKTLDTFYGPRDAQQAIHEHLRRIPSLLMRVAQGDAWQHQVYTATGHTREERHDAWLANDERFSLGYDWSGIDPDRRRKSWHNVLHFFVVPFYFIEYGFAQFGALQVAVNAEKDPARALAAYKAALVRGPQKSTADLFAEAGAEFIPSTLKVRELMNWIRKGLDL